MCCESLSYTGWLITLEKKQSNGPSDSHDLKFGNFNLTEYNKIHNNIPPEKSYLEQSKNLLNVFNFFQKTN